jgi:hypothetical protein
MVGKTAGDCFVKKLLAEGELRGQKDGRWFFFLEV